MKLFTIAGALSTVVIFALPFAKCDAQRGGRSGVTVALVPQLDQASAYGVIVRPRHGEKREVILLKEADVTPVHLATAMIMLGQRRRVDHGDAAVAERIYLNGDVTSAAVDSMTLRLAVTYLRRLSKAPYYRLSEGSKGRAIGILFR